MLYKNHISHLSLQYHIPLYSWTYMYHFYSINLYYQKNVLHPTPYLYPFLYYHLPPHLLLMLLQDLSASTFSQYLCLIETAAFSGMDSAFLYIGYGR